MVRLQLYQEISAAIKTSELHSPEYCNQTQNHRAFHLSTQYHIMITWKPYEERGRAEICFVCLFVGGCVQPSQPLEVTSGLIRAENSALNPPRAEVTLM